jgi:hypothetical protein
MDYYDVFNGDADGICALHQYRLHIPCPQAELITGVKRNINLLTVLQNISHSRISVFDISLDKNRFDIERLLAHENTIFYVDHHYSGAIPDENNLETHINIQPQTCTSLIISSLLKDRFAKWAIAGAFGDNLDESAKIKAQQLGLNPEQTTNLKELGLLLNYNGYGQRIEDLYFHPAEIYRQMQPYRDPLDFHADCAALSTLRIGYHNDMERAQSFTPLFDMTGSRVYKLPPEAWARRVAGVFSNTLAREKPEKAHALLTNNNDGSFRISVRAPLNNRSGADTLCRQFPSGGGRAAAAGINQLPSAMLNNFLSAFSKHFSLPDTI